MTTFRRLGIASTAIVLAVGTSAYGAGSSAAAAAPELHVQMIGSSQVRFTATTHGVEDCWMHIWSGPAYSPTPMGTQTEFTGIPTYPVQTIAMQITCPDGSHSPKVFAYGPRNPINDLRTQFNQSTNGAFGS